MVTSKALAFPSTLYIRALTAAAIPPGSQSAVVLRAIPSELILWPQAWNTKKPLDPGPLVFNRLTPKKTAVPDDYQEGGKVRLRDALPSAPADVKNWKEFLEFINNDSSSAYYNAVIADPKAPFVSVSTRLHVVDDGKDALNFNVTVENSYMPHGTLVELSSPSGKIQLRKTPLSDSYDVGVHVSLPPGFDDTITITVYPPSGALIETFAWVSLQANVVVVQPFQNKGVPMKNVYLLGAQNIVFHEDAVANLRLASPAANKLRKYSQPTKSGALIETQQSAVAIANALKITGPATGWWFRDQIQDINKFPRTENVCHSPDIQPVGASPLPNLVSTLGGSNANKDYSNDHHIDINQGAPNYIYIRGNCTLGSDYDTQVRLFCIPNNLLLYPTNYAKYSVNDFDERGNPFAAVRTIKSASSNSFNVLDLPFDLLDPPPPPSGHDHHCLIAETRHPSNENPDPDWPHEDTGAFSSSTGFNTWVGSIPTVSQRNVGFKSGGAEFTCTCIVAIPPNIYPSSAMWTLEVDAENAPVGSAWRLTGSGPTIPGLQIGFNQTTITATNMVQGCHFTGLPSSGHEFSAVLQWYGQGHSAGAGMKLSFSLHTSTPPTGPKLLVKESHLLSNAAASWPFMVGIHHPGVVANRGNQNKGYLGHRFKDIGFNTWPYAKNEKISPTVVYSVGGDHWNFH